MKAGFWSALACSIMLIGCRAPAAGGGGGGAQPTQGATATGQQAAQPTAQQAVPVSQSLDKLTQASESANRAHSNLVKQDWNSASRDIGQARTHLKEAEKSASPAMKSQLQSLDTMAARTELEIKKHSTRASRDTIALVNRLNLVASAATSVKAGGGKPGRMPGKSGEKE